MRLIGRSVKILLAVLLVAGAAVAVEWNLKKEGDGTAVQYRPLQVTRGDIHVRVMSTGTVQPENRLEIKPPVAGRIERIEVDEGAVVRKGDLLATLSSTERAAMLDAARAQGASELKRWEDYYKATPIIAPIDGMLILRNIEPGQTVTTQDAVLVLSDRLIVQAQVDETDIAKIRLGQKVTVSLDAYSDKQIPSSVSKIAYEAKTVNNVTTYLVDVLPEAVPEYMRSGMTANISFDVSDHENVLTLPAFAISTRDGKSTVLKGDPKDPDARDTVEINVGESDGEHTEILSGLREGDTVLAPALGEKRAEESSPFMMRPGPGGRKR